VTYCATRVLKSCCISPEASWSGLIGYAYPR
jgi:hypothetical protein